MKVHLVLGTLILLFTAATGHAQQTYLAPVGTDISGRVAVIQELLTDDPLSVKLNLELAKLHCSVGEVKPCEEYAAKVIRLSPDTPESLQARQAAMFGNYAAGRIKRSMEHAQMALEQDSGAEPAGIFVRMLTASKDSFWNGELPEQMSWYGFHTANEFIQAVRTGGAGMRGSDSGGSADCVLIGSGRQMCWQAVPGWIGRQNIFLNNGSRALLLYTKNEAQPVPSIGITVDTPPRNVESAVDYAQLIALAVTENPEITVRGPEKMQLHGYDASLMWLEMPKGLRSAWYQFYFDGQILSLQLMTTVDEYEEHFRLLEEFADSMQIGDDALGPLGSLRSTPAQ
ncbi:MAG: hypothetical protein KC897_09675 [Candidatus Omnitrophica bacterium]|nr:hypothetical protein [Candidatus Omnitrophota bacterium]MCB9721705.1 hypothetical protein [Candidatus Omnitrophota bacterium]